jgi:hypothetical protein
MHELRSWLIPRQPLANRRPAVENAEDRPLSPKVTTVLFWRLCLFLPWLASIARDIGDLRIRDDARVRAGGFSRFRIETNGRLKFFQHDLMDCLIALVVNESVRRNQTSVCLIFVGGSATKWDNLRKR